jgi:hypothetical protein
LNGKKPVTPDMVLKKTIRPALERAGIKDKVIGWHSFRHSLATNLRAAGVGLKTAQELLRHANWRITLEVYTRAISSTKREANDRVMQMMLEAGTKQLSAPSPAPSSCFWDCHYATKPFILLCLVAGTTGLEPATSAVTVSLKPVTYRNAGQWVAPIGPKRHTEEPLLCPCCARKFSL